MSGAVPPAALLAAGLSAAAVYLLAQARGLAAARFAAKPVPVLCLALWAWSFGPAGRLAAVGLGLCAVADVLLEMRFLWGVLAFLLAHLAYVAAFAQREGGAHLLRLVPFAAYGAGMFLFLRPGLGRLELPVAAYVLAIVAMMWRASALAAGSAGGGLALSGALLFAASDSLIALDRFRAPIAGVRYPVILLYWAGQALIAASFRRA